jgi:hypothetical protein
MLHRRQPCRHHSHVVTAVSIYKIIRTEQSPTTLSLGGDLSSRVVPLRSPDQTRRDSVVANIDIIYLKLVSGCREQAQRRQFVSSSGARGFGGRGGRRGGAVALCSVCGVCSSGGHGHDDPRWRQRRRRRRRGSERSPPPTRRRADRAPTASTSTPTRRYPPSAPPPPVRSRRGPKAPRGVVPGGLHLRILRHAVRPSPPPADPTT